MPTFQISLVQINRIQLFFTNSLSECQLFKSLFSKLTKITLFFTNSLTECQHCPNVNFSNLKTPNSSLFCINSLSECQLFKSQNTKFITIFLKSLSECQLFKSQIFQIFNIYQEMTVYFPNTCLQVSLKKFLNSLAVVSI